MSKKHVANRVSTDLTAEIQAAKPEHDGNKPSKHDSKRNGYSSAPAVKQEKPKKVKIPGLVPTSYTRNPKHEAMRCAQEQQIEVKQRREAWRRQQLVQLAECRLRFQDAVDGVPGNYIIGKYIDDSVSVVAFANYTVGKRLVPIMGKEPVTVIIGYKKVAVPLDFIFCQNEEVRFASGEAGEIQVAILEFWREALSMEIKSARPKWEAAIIKARAITTLATGPVLATVDGLTVKPAEKGQKPSPLSLFTPSTAGKFNFSDAKNNHCIVKQSLRGGEMTLAIMNICENHTLAKAGVKKGCWFYSRNLKSDRQTHGQHSDESLLKAFILEKLAKYRQSADKKAA